ncbi:MAG: NAD(P)/FAD-dependent oxidoreductase [Blastocatellia bacterium]
MKNRLARTRSRPNRKQDRQYDVVIAGAGPAGSVLAWALARRGVNVLVVDRAHFPREKVCGDYVEPRGLRLLDEMGCLDALEADSPLPIAYSATFVNSECRYRAKIPFYGLREDLPPHGYIIPRERLDHLLLETAAKAGATVEQGTSVTSIEPGKRAAVVGAERDGRTVIYRAKLVAGADGVNSVVARSAGLLSWDPRYTAVSQRAYAGGIDGDIGEAAFYFDEEFFPGYGWMFPMGGGVVNLGVGILSETAERLSINIPRLFDEFFDKLKRSHHRCEKLELIRRPIGGIVKTYGGAGPNYFSSGLLVGDAGSFVDPMTGEGITPAMESALIAADVIESALSAGRTDSEFLSAYEAGFRAYFDPSMIFLDLCAATMRNERLGASWLKAMVRGCEIAQRDSDFGRTTGAYFGGLEINPRGILSAVLINMLGDLATLGPRTLSAMLGSEPSPLLAAVGDTIEWQMSWWKSALNDPVWHASWAMDLQRKWLRFFSMMNNTERDPRFEGLVKHRR